jgi:hypothetical protein
MSSSRATVVPPCFSRGHRPVGTSGGAQNGRVPRPQRRLRRHYRAPSPQPRRLRSRTHPRRGCGMHGRTVWFGFACDRHADQLVAARPLMLRDRDVLSQRRDQERTELAGKRWAGEQEGPIARGAAAGRLIERANTWAARQRCDALTRWVHRCASMASPALRSRRGGVRVLQGEDDGAVALLFWGDDEEPALVRVAEQARPRVAIGPLSLAVGDARGDDERARNVDRLGAQDRHNGESGRVFVNVLGREPPAVEHLATPSPSPREVVPPPGATRTADLITKCGCRTGQGGDQQIQRRFRLQGEKVEPIEDDGGRTEKADRGNHRARGA